MNVSNRLKNIVDMIEPCRLLADIGCDHGITAIEALRTSKAQRVIAADINEGPLSAARENSVREGTADRTVFVLSDGLYSIPQKEDIECIVIAGMGGILIRDILERGGLDRFKSLRQLILGPQSDLCLVREFADSISALGIASERCLFDEGKYYFLMDLRRDVQEPRPYDKEELYFGRNIDRACKKTYSDYLHFRKRVLSEARASAARGRNETARQRIIDFDREIELINTILKQEE